MTEYNTEIFYNMNTDGENPLNLLSKEIIGRVSVTSKALTDSFYSICERELTLLAGYF